MKEYDYQAWDKSIKKNEDATIIDVRSLEEYEENHLNGAIHINVENPPQFMGRINNLDKDKNYYLYCNSGRRANQACLVMEYNGFGKTFNLKGGLESSDYTL